MFKFFKEKLKKSVQKFSKDIEEEFEESEDITEKKEVETEEKQEIKEKVKEEKEVKKIIKEKPEEKIKTSENIEKPEKKKEFVKAEPEKKQSFFQKLTSKKISEDKFEDLFWELEVILLENNISVKVIEKIKEDLKEKLVNKPLKGKISKLIEESLEESIKEILKSGEIDFSKKPLVICFLGINGSGKTTTIAKFANKLKKEGKSVVLAAADTFRAAAIDQLEEHANKLNIKLIKHDYGSDPAAVAFDAIKHAKSKDIDVVLIDTAGRMHSNVNLVDEMKKIIKVADPDYKIFVGESITGNDCVEQAEKFNEAIEIDGIILSKADIDEKGGAAISVSYVTGKPIYYIGTGQEYDDLEKFEPKKILDILFSKSI